jgi:glycine/D-amino acid oxidase-like deaminating enzyme
LSISGSDSDYIAFVKSNNDRLLNGLANVDFQSDLCLAGGLHLARDDDEFEILRQEARIIHKATGRVCPVLNREEVQAFLADTNFSGGFFIPCESTLNPYKVVNGLYDMIEAHHGLRTFTGSQVESIRYNADGTLRVNIRRRGSINAKRVVYCTGAYTPSLLPEFTDVIKPVRVSSAITESLPFQERENLTSMSIIVGNNDVHIRTHEDRLLVSGLQEEPNRILDGEINQASYDKLRYFTARYFPFLSVDFECAWSRVFATTPDGLPLIGPIPDRPNQYIMAGFNDRSLQHAVLGSIIIYDYITSDSSSVLASDMFLPSRFV